MFHSIADRFSEFHDISLGSSETDIVLVFIDVVLLVAASVDVRDVVSAGANGITVRCSSHWGGLGDEWTCETTLASAYVLHRLSAM